jgi:RNA polymerase sigma-70 factor
MCTSATTETSYLVCLRDVAAGVYKAGFDVHGDLDLRLDEYSSRLACIISKWCGHNCNNDTILDLTRQLHTTDLYLSTACALHRDKAWRRFDSVYRKYLNDLVSYICSAHSIATEIKETASVHLFLPDRTGQSRILSYDGRSSLATWLRVIITNRIINEGHRKCNALQYDKPSPELEDQTALPLIESCLQVSRYEPMVCAAVQWACEGLADRERELLLWRFDRQAQLGEIAHQLSVHQSTITRTLDRIARKFRDKVISHLSSLHLDSAAINECLSVLIDGKCQSISILDYLRSAGSDQARRRNAPPA